jgi:energy-coupling factor transport system permease protein
VFGLFKKNKKNRSGRLILRYVEGNSLLHRLDPRAKIFMLLLFSGTIIIISAPIPTVILFVFIMALAAVSGLIKEWSRSMIKGLPFLAVVVVLNSLFSKTSYGHVYYAIDLGILHPSISDGSIISAITMGFRLMTLLGTSELFIMSTKFEDFVKGLRKLMVPFTFAFSLGLALRSITYLTTDVKNILDAQRSRGLEIDKRDIIKNYRRFLALFVPMIICLLFRSKNISEAMHVRAFRHTKHPTMYRGIKLRVVDYGFMLTITAIAVILVYMG